jgi:hypothetical protein
MVDVTTRAGKGAPISAAEHDENLEYIIGHFQGATAPTSPYASQLWADTATSTMKIRNTANSAWITLGTLDDDAVFAPNKVDQTSETGAALIPVGTEAQRPTPAKGQLRFNDDIDKFEGYDGTEWGTVGGGGGFFKGENGSVGDATTGPGDIFRINEQELNTSVTISGTENASCTGPLAVASGVTLTVSSGGSLVIL